MGQMEKANTKSPQHTGQLQNAEQLQYAGQLQQADQRQVDDFMRFRQTQQDTSNLRQLVYSFLEKEQSQPPDMLQVEKLEHKLKERMAADERARQLEQSKQQQQSQRMLVLPDSKTHYEPVQSRPRSEQFGQPRQEQQQQQQQQQPQQRPQDEQQQQ
jgi:hypothetical protein